MDVILELHRCGRLATDANRRRLVGLSRRAETPRSLVYEWAVGTPEFRVVADPFTTRFRENWATVRAVLEARRRPATHRELLADWPAGRIPPSATLLYEWLARAAAEGLAVRQGLGRRAAPYRFALPPAAGSVPVLPELPPLR